MMLILVLTGNQLVAQDQQSMARKDSLSRLGARHICVSTESYLIDSLLLVPATYGYKVMKWAKGNRFFVNQLSKDSIQTYIETDKTIILNGKVLISKNPPISIEENRYTKIKSISESRLVKEYNIVNRNGGVVIISK
ncbi:MAG: hypothetical protein HOP30_07550 [Cyclobacteriaceae bacterium]|nr:hypothetical protein [Cyclobacteriaceae bacterium]